MAARIFLSIPVLMLVVATGLPSPATAQTSVFTYQGRLHDGGVPANGSYDLRFILYTAAGGGSQVGTTIYVDDMPIGSGLFATDLDFGVAAFPGADRWLEVAVRPGAVSNADRSPASYTTLNPRQRVNPTPYALRARDADTVDGFDSSVFLTGVPNPLAITNNLPGGSGSVASVTNSASTGLALYASGYHGIEGQAAVPLGIGVWGGAFDANAFASPAGLCGSSSGGSAIIGLTNTGAAVVATSSGATGSPRAIVASTDAEFGKAVLATNSHATQNTSAELASRISGSVVAPSINGVPAAMVGTSSVIGIYGRSNGFQTGVWGESGSWAGVAGVTSTGQGVWGHAYDGAGIGVLASGATTAGGLGTALQIQSGTIKVPSAGIGTSTPVFIHRAAAGNITSNYTTIDHPQTNGDPNAILIITPNWNPGGVGGIYDNHPIGVFYTGSRWAIFNQDLVAMPVNAAFNVLIIKAGSGSEPQNITEGGPSLNQGPRSPIETGLEGIQVELAKSGPRK